VTRDTDADVVIAIGAMRLSTAEDRDDARSAEVLDAALRAGVRMIDTADVYALDETDIGHNERLIAAAIARWSDQQGTGDREQGTGNGGEGETGNRQPATGNRQWGDGERETGNGQRETGRGRRGEGDGERGEGDEERGEGAGVTVVTKSGLRRDGARWREDGRAAHIVAAAKATRERLGGGALALHLLHAIDPQVDLTTSVRGLAKLLDEGVASRVGLSNVNRTQLDAALAIVPVSAVEVEINPNNVDAIRGGLVERCAERGIIVLAHRPLGGVARAKKWRRIPFIAEMANAKGATGEEIVLAWVRGLAPGVVPLPGVTRVDSVASVVRAASIVLDAGEREELDRKWLRFGGARPARLSGSGSGSASGKASEVVIVMGMQGAGKSTTARAFLALGYDRFNRDSLGGSLDKMAVLLDAALTRGISGAVLDNTYPTRASRAPVIEVARRHNVPIRCVWIDIPIEDAQTNAAARLIETYGRLPEPAELNKLAKKDPSAFRPTTQFNWRRECEPPSPDEGFIAVERIPFRRERMPFSGTTRALVVDVDHTDGTWDAWRDAGWLVVGTAWRPDGGDVRADIDVEICRHPAGPPICWCRKPLPGLGLLLARRHGIDLARSIHVGSGAADKGFAARLGMRFVDAADLPASPPLVD
jgi:aryl-alcohol dehydrogenase-like predicted oxidoreductase